MGYLADIYVIQKTRSKRNVIHFLDHFIPSRRESASEYLIPEYSGSPTHEFDNADELMTYLESNQNSSHRIYWRNLDDSSPNKHAIVLFTEDDYIIYGISRNADMSGEFNSYNEDECLQQMKDYFNTEMGYITYETPPVNSYEEFEDILNEINT